MAECKICGFINGKLPHNWTNWQCPQCEHDEIFNSVGHQTDKEKKNCLNGHHASAPHKSAFVAEIDHKPSKKKALSHIQRLKTGHQVKVVMLNEEKVCPICGFSREQGFDYGEENGKGFGCRCGNCGFSYGKEGYKQGIICGSNEIVRDN